MRKVMVTAALIGDSTVRNQTPIYPSSQMRLYIAQALQCREVGSAKGNKDADSYLC